MERKQEELISIIVPIFNIKEYLERCVDSIIKQTYTNLEIILVDDGSTDGTSDLVDVLAKKDTRIKAFHKENGGSSSARNLGISKATGAYYGFIDSDDYIEPFMFEKLLDAIHETGMPIAQGGREEIDEQGNILPDICTPPKFQTVYESKAFMKELLLHVGDCSFCTKLTDARLFSGTYSSTSFSKDEKRNGRESAPTTGMPVDKLGKMEFPVGVLNEDFHVLVQMLPYIPGIVSIPERVYHVFYKSGSNTRVQDENRFSRVYGDNVDNADMVTEIVGEKYSELLPIAMRFGYYQRLDYMLHIPIPQMRSQNIQYRNIVRYLKKHTVSLLRNSYLSVKERLYLLLLGWLPVSVRKVHRFSMKLRK